MWIISSLYLNVSAPDFNIHILFPPGLHLPPHRPLFLPFTTRAQRSICLFPCILFCFLCGLSGRRFFQKKWATVRTRAGAGKICKRHFSESGNGSLCPFRLADLDSGCSCGFTTWSRTSPRRRGLCSACTTNAMCSLYRESVLSSFSPKPSSFNVNGSEFSLFTQDEGGIFARRQLSLPSELLESSLLQSVCFSDERDTVLRAVENGSDVKENSAFLLSNTESWKSYQWGDNSPALRRNRRREWETEERSVVVSAHSRSFATRHPSRSCSWHGSVLSNPIPLHLCNEECPTWRNDVVFLENIPVVLPGILEELLLFFLCSKFLHRFGWSQKDVEGWTFDALPAVGNGIHPSLSICETVVSYSSSRSRTCFLLLSFLPTTSFSAHIRKTGGKRGPLGWVGGNGTRNSHGWDRGICARTGLVSRPSSQPLHCESSCRIRNRTHKTQKIKESSREYTPDPDSSLSSKSTHSSQILLSHSRTFR